MHASLRRMTKKVNRKREKKKSLLFSPAHTSFPDRSFFIPPILPIVGAGPLPTSARTCIVLSRPLQKRMLVGQAIRADRRVAKVGLQISRRSVSTTTPVKIGAAGIHNAHILVAHVVVLYDRNAYHTSQQKTKLRNIRHRPIFLDPEPAHIDA